MKVEQITLKNITPYKNDPRIHKQDHILEIINSIQTFEFTNPTLADENKQILAGHGRYLASKQLSLTRAPAIELKHLDASQKSISHC